MKKINWSNLRNGILDGPEKKLVCSQVRFRPTWPADRPRKLNLISEVLKQKL